MTRIAFLTSHCMTTDGAARRDDAWEHDIEFEPLRRACASRGHELEARVWDDATLGANDYDAYVIGTTWDYQQRVEDFLSVLARLESARPLFNPLDVVRWNLDKRYLAELGARGVNVIPTIYADSASDAVLMEAFERFACDSIVVKPLVGAGAWRQVKVERDGARPPLDVRPPAAAMLQPFVPSVVEEGEYSLLFFGGVFSHCALKRPKQGDYRVQSLYGGHEVAHAPSDAELSAAREVLAAVDQRLLYARVDMVRDATGRLALMELEVVEPYLYPEQGPRLGENFVTALEALL